MNNPVFNFEALPAAMRALPQWLCWKWDKTDPEKPKKVPFYVCGKRRWGVQGGSADRAKLATFEEVAQKIGNFSGIGEEVAQKIGNFSGIGEEVAQKIGNFSGIGFALLPGDDLICLDLDQHVDKYSGEPDIFAQELINLTESYTEKSVSGTGLHIICAGITESIREKATTGLEIFCRSQFIICTGWHLPDTPTQVKPLGARVLKWVQEKIKRANGPVNGTAHPFASRPSEPGRREKVESALLVLDPNEYDSWIRIGMSVQCELGETGFASWNYWSSKSDKYPGESEMLGKWKSFDPDKGITGGTLFRMAMDRGWAPPMGARRPEQARPTGSSKSSTCEPDERSDHAERDEPGAPLDEESPKPDLTKNKRGSIINNTSNALILLEELLLRENMTAQHCVFSERDLLTVHGKVLEITDVDVLKLAVQIQRITGAAGIGRESVRDALQTVLAQNTIDPVRDWLDNLTWDSAPRLDTWLTAGLGAKDEGYVRTFGANTLIGCVARQYRPGVKMDNMLVLEGEQGIGKSLLLSALFSEEWFGDGLPQFSDPGFGRLLRGKLCFEVAEMSSMTRTDIEHTKKTIAIQIDRYRDPYARRESEHPRRCILIGTTNEDEYLVDQTGNRRFWPVRCGKIDLEWIAANREQLFAEAIVRYQAGATWHLVPLDEARTEQEVRRVRDPWEAPIAEWLDWNASITHVSIESLLLDVIKTPTEKHTTREMKRVASILRAMKWVRPAEKSRRAGRYIRWWTHPDRTPE